MSKKPKWINPALLPKTGFPPGLLQDDSLPLTNWFASRIDARHSVRKAMHLIRLENESRTQKTSGE